MGEVSVKRTLNSIETFSAKLEREGERIKVLQDAIEDLIAKVDSLEIDVGFEKQKSAEMRLRKVSFELSVLSTQFWEFAVMDLGSAYDDLEEVWTQNSKLGR